MISSDESSFCKCNNSGNQLVWRSKNKRRLVVAELWYGGIFLFMVAGN